MSDILLYAAIAYAVQGIVWAVVVRKIVSYRGYSGGHWGLWGFLFQLLAALVALSLTPSDVVYISDKLDKMSTGGGSSYEPKPSALSAPPPKKVSRDGKWQCSSCGEMNDSSSISCKNCGEYK